MLKAPGINQGLSPPDIWIKLLLLTPLPIRRLVAIPNVPLGDFGTGALVVPMVLAVQVS